MQALGAEVEASISKVIIAFSQLLALVLLLLFSETVLGLSDLELALSVESDETDAKVGSSEIDGEILALFLA